VCGWGGWCWGVGWPWAGGRVFVALVGWWRVLRVVRFWRGCLCRGCSWCVSVCVWCRFCCWSCVGLGGCLFVCFWMAVGGACVFLFVVFWFLGGLGLVLSAVWGGVGWRPSLGVCSGRVFGFVCAIRGCVGGLWVFWSWVLVGVGLWWRLFLWRVVGVLPPVVGLLCVGCCGGLGLVSGRPVGGSIFLVPGCCLLVFVPPLGWAVCWVGGVRSALLGVGAAGWGGGWVFGCVGRGPGGFGRWVRFFVRFGAGAAGFGRCLFWAGGFSDVWPVGGVGGGCGVLSGWGRLLVLGVVCVWCVGRGCWCRLLCFVT